MFKALFELLITIGIVLVARAVLTSILRGVSRAASQSFQNAAQNNSQGSGQSRQQGFQPTAGGDLHKDPVCGTYVAEGAALHRQANGQSFYYCSRACYEKHSLVAR